MASSSDWTTKQINDFKMALEVFDEDTPDRWHNVARAVGCGKTVDDVKRRYEKLVVELRSIESGEVPLPNYRTPGQNDGNMTDENCRMKNLKLG